MVKRPRLSKGELEVARLLWKMGPATVREIHTAFRQEREADFATIQTFLRRIEQKGYATSKLDGRTRVYSATAKPQTVIRETVDDLVNRLFGGETMPLVRHLIEDRGIESADIDELRALVDQLDREAKPREGKGKS